MQTDDSIDDFNIDEGKPNAKKLVTTSNISDVSSSSLTKCSASDHGTIGPYYKTSIKVSKNIRILISYFYYVI